MAHNSDAARDPLELQTEAAAVYLGIMAVAILNVLPALSGVLLSVLGWNEREIGHFASADFAGGLLGTLLTTVLRRRSSFRDIGTIGMGLLALADLYSCTTVSPDLLIGARFIGGIGSGLAIAVAFLVFARSRPERGIAFWSIGQLIFGLIAITVIPHAAIKFGWQSMFLALGILAVPGVALSQYLPRIAVPDAPEPRISSAPTRMNVWMWLAVIGVGVFYSGQGGVWPYLDVIGIKSGISQSSVEMSVSLAAASALAGSLVIVAVGRRFGRAVPLLISFLITVASLLTVRSTNPWVFRVALSMFTFSWPIFAAYQFGAIAVHDRSGQVGAYVTTANFAGFMLGSLLAAEVSAGQGFRGVVWLALALDTFAVVLLVPLLFRGTRNG
jgi:predicted MFS family arabinose efflux permease